MITLYHNHFVEVSRMQNVYTPETHISPAQAELILLDLSNIFHRVHHLDVHWADISESQCLQPGLNHVRS